MKKLTLLLVLISQISFAQTDLVKGVISEIEFKEDTILSVFNWVTDNISYDVAQLNALEKGSGTNTSFRTEEEFNNYLLTKVIRQKKGVCQHYSLLFDALVRELGYESFIINGYTKDEKGKVVTSIGHSWNAVKVSGAWRLYDPTWGSGYVNESNKFIKKYKPEWYNVAPAEMIKDHMPYDPVWQLSSNPVDYGEFKSGKTSGKSDVEFSYENLIDEHLKKNSKEQMLDELNRSKELGDGIRLVEKRRRYLIKNINLYGITSQQESIDKAYENSQIAVQLYNEYVVARNQQFKRKSRNVEWAEKTLAESKEKIQSTLDILTEIEVEDSKMRKSLDTTIRQSESLLKKIIREQQYIGNLK